MSDLTIVHAPGVGKYHYAEPGQNFTVCGRSTRDDGWRTVRSAPAHAEWCRNCTRNLVDIVERAGVPDDVPLGKIRNAPKSKEASSMIVSLRHFAEQFHIGADNQHLWDDLSPAQVEQFRDLLGYAQAGIDRIRDVLDDVSPAPVTERDARRDMETVLAPFPEPMRGMLRAAAERTVAVTPEPEGARYCEQCSDPLPVTARADALWCSNACRQKNYRERRRLG